MKLNCKKKKLKKHLESFMLKKYLYCELHNFISQTECGWCSGLRSYLRGMSQVVRAGSSLSPLKYLSMGYLKVLFWDVFYF